MAINIIRALIILCFLLLLHEKLTYITCSEVFLFCDIATTEELVPLLLSSHGAWVEMDHSRAI